MPHTAIHSDENKDLLHELKQPEIHQALTGIIHRLPEIERTLQSLEQLTQFSMDVVKDQTTMEALEERLQLSRIDESSLEALVALLAKLPTILEMVEQIEKIALFIKHVVHDEQSMEQIKTSMAELPFIQQQKEVKDFFEAVQTRHESIEQHISIFTIIKWMKEPHVQKYLKYMQATLDVLKAKK
ncbi:hypothetical protein [Virgibacillus sp. Bac330]|uniref:hypothetical protein n=1 Tax=Virgibacillus sp. Bac330 TaxID=2419841 RepID=UPI000EF54554|nr:hypothetical protein [Virgibacillus sp. Bac330]